MYKELSKNAKPAEDEDAGCTVEEVKETEAPKEAAKPEEEPKEERVYMSDMVNEIDVGNEFVSNLEELD